MLLRVVATHRVGPSIFIFFLIFIIIPFIFFDYSHYLTCPSCSPLNVTSTSNTTYQILHNTEDERTSIDDYSIWCLHMAHRLDSEQHLPQSPILQVPPINSSTLHRLPYHYSQWKSFPRLPRRITPCEHSLMMHLLMIIERICRKHHIIFMISDGTLLGSIRHHDIIPWDDNIDVMIPVEEQTRFTDIIQQMNKTLLQHHVILDANRKREYYKVFFKNTPKAGRNPYNFPFVDIFFYLQNKTHLWQMADPNTIINIEYVFPLVLRPLGELWLPAARKPRLTFKFDPFDQCRGHFWDHRNKTRQPETIFECDDLRDIYPFVDRYNETSSSEVLRINNTIIHTIIYN